MGSKILLCSAMLLGPMMALCRAQDTALVRPSRGVLSHASTIRSERATTICPAFLGDHRDQLDDSIPKDSTGATCRVEGTHALADAVGLQWRVVKYLTRYVFPADSIDRRLAPRSATDTVNVLDVVIYSVERGHSEWRAEWQGWAEWRTIRGVDVSLGVHGGLAVFSIVSCVNGTGGCDQHFVGRNTQTWIPLDETYRTQLGRRFGGHPFWKGIVVDVQTLRGRVPLYSIEDANCCASRELRLTLKLQGTSIVVGSAGVHKAVDM